MIISVFLPGLGCSKNPCVYCNQETATAKIQVSNQGDIENRIRETMIEFLNSKKEIRYPIDVAFYGSNFTAIAFKQQKQIISFVQTVFEELTKKNHKDNLRIRISTRPDVIAKEQLLDLKIRFNLHMVEIGVQSMDDDVLFLSRREHTRSNVIHAAKVIRRIGLELSCHQMTGLPGATPESDIETAHQIVDLRPEYVRIHPTLILKDTLLEKMFLSGEYMPQRLDEAVVLTEQLVKIYRDAGIKIIRIGVHPSELLVDNIVAGPWHPSFRDLVEGKHLLLKASSQLSDHRGTRVKLRISPTDETYLRGKDNTHYNELQSSFELEDIEIVKDPGVERGQIFVDRL